MTWAEIAEHCEKATGAVTEIDVTVALAAGQPQAYFNGFATNIDGYPHGGFAEIDGPDLFVDGRTWGGGGRSWKAPAYTASLDACLSLMEEVLGPDTGWEIIRYEEGRKGVQVCLRDEIVTAATPPLALLAAIARAKAAETDNAAA